QGGFNDDLRRESAQTLGSLAFDGFGIGGLSLGEPKTLTYSLLAAQTAILPRDRPRYLMGVGTPADLIEAIARGVDMFDCVLPTRIARNGSILTIGGRINLRKRRFIEDSGPPDDGFDCYTFPRVTQAYPPHLFLARRVGQVREAIGDGRFGKLVTSLRDQWVHAPLP